MKWIRLDKVQRYALISILLTLLWVGDIIEYFLQNPIWINIFAFASWIIGFYVLWLWYMYTYERIKEELWRKYEKELEEIKKR